MLVSGGHGCRQRCDSLNCALILAFIVKNAIVTMSTLLGVVKIEMLSATKRFSILAVLHFIMLP
jgi:hypothetical protein